MPYVLQQRGNQVCVVKKGTSKSYGCHPTREKAMAQMKALYANESLIGATEKDFSQAARDKAASKGHALSDGSFPINSVADLKNAIHAIGRAKNPAAAKKHIIKRARALGRTDLLPADWHVGAREEGGDPIPTRRLEIIAAEEATVDAAKMEAVITIVRPGISENGLNHTPVAIRRAVAEGIWNGSKMFVDHGPMGEMERMPWRRPLDALVSKITDTWIGDEGEAKGQVRFLNKQFAEFAQEAKEDIGVSMATWLEGGPPHRENGRKVTDVIRYVKNRSVDWVAFPAAGGAIDKFIPAMESLDVDWNELTIDDLKAHRPDIITELASTHATDDDDAGDSGDGNPPPAGLTGAEVDQKIAAAVESARGSWMDDYRKERATRDQIMALVDESGLPSKARQQLIAKFDGAVVFAEEDVQKAIDDQIDILKEGGWGGPKVVGVGQSGVEEDRTKSANTAELEDAGYHTLAAVESAMGYEPAGEN